MIFDEHVFYSGAGNSFLVVDNRELKFEITQLLEELGTADGLILAEPSSYADIFMRVINRDGSEAEMCGNGVRCLLHFLKELGLNQTLYRVETLAGIHEGWFVEDEVAIRMTHPSDLKLFITPVLHFIDTGVPHAVTFVDSVEEVEVDALGKAIRHSPLFAPAGANANFAQVVGDQTLSVRTFERGVEQETLACGTGAVATALIAHKLFELNSPIHILVRSQELLKISFTHDWSEVVLQGPVKRERTLVKEKRQSIII